jgi:hypothetical protein
MRSLRLVGFRSSWHLRTTLIGSPVADVGIVGRILYHLAGALEMSRSLLG